MKYFRTTTIVIISAPFFFSSCKEKKDSPKIQTVECYASYNMGDTVVLKMQHAGDIVTGTLQYKIREKDANSGTIKGTTQGDLLLADYTFTSEGLVSVRQVAFKKIGDSYVEGFGEIDTTTTNIQFKNTDLLDFNNSIKLTPCN